MAGKFSREEIGGNAPERVAPVGATFIAMHLKPQSRAGLTGAPRRRSQRAPPPRILVVDDDLVLCVFQAEILSSAGFEVEMAEDGEAGWQALQVKNYDLLITDNNMPKLSGIELLKMLRSEDPDMPVIMVSGAMPTEELERQPHLHLAAMLPKPFTGDKLLATVKKVLRQTHNAPGQTETVRQLKGGFSPRTRLLVR